MLINSVAERSAISMTPIQNLYLNFIFYEYTFINHRLILLTKT